jgi:hypothetical protein
MNKFKATVARLGQESEQRKQLRGIDCNWVNKRLEELNISRAQLMQNLLLDKSSLSIILNGHRRMTKSLKGAFFYYFAY